MRGYDKGGFDKGFYGIQLQEELDAYDKIHRESEANIESKVDKIMFLENYIKDHGLEVPDWFEGEYADPERANIVAKRYPPYHSDEIWGVSVPINLMSADEKIDELTQVIEEQKIHIDTLEQERAELIDSKADFMSEKINEIVNREVNKELEQIKSNPDQLGLINIKENDEDSDEFLIQTKDVLAITQSMIKDLKIQNHDSNERTGSDIFYQIAKVDDARSQNNGFEVMFSFENSKVLLQFNQVTERVVALYQKVFDLIDTSKENQSVSYVSTGKSSSGKSVNQERIYERKLPPNVEEMLKQKRQQLASQLSYQ